jgi:DNA-binding transcriptional regulator LsrR (DeoR family)
VKKIKLTEQEIDTLCWMHRVAGVPQAKLARDYEISRTTVARIVAQHKKRTDKAGK